MSTWPASKAKRVLAALERIGWLMKRQRGSHRLLERTDWPDYQFAFHDQDEIGPIMLAKAKSGRRQFNPIVSSVQEITNRLVPAREQPFKLSAYATPNAGRSAIL